MLKVDFPACIGFLVKANYMVSRLGDHKWKYFLGSEVQEGFSFRGLGGNRASEIASFTS